MVRQNTITQLHNTTPQQLTDTILRGVKMELNQFKESFEPTTKEKYLTRLQTAQMLSISLTTLNEWSKKKILNSFKLGNRTYYKLSEIENNINNSNTL